MSQTNGDQPDVLDLDAFWAEQERKTTPVRILGEVVHLPPPGGLPMNLQRRMEQVDAHDEAGMLPLLGEVFGDPGLVERWGQSAMTARQMRMLLIWGLSNGTGRPLTFQEAQNLVDRQMSGGTGEAEGRTGSGGTGRSSKPTSPGSTGSPRRRSPG